MEPCREPGSYRVLWDILWRGVTGCCYRSICSSILVAPLPSGGLFLVGHVLGRLTRRSAFWRDTRGSLRWPASESRAWLAGRDHGEGSAVHSQGGAKREHHRPARLAQPLFPMGDGPLTQAGFLGKPLLRQPCLLTQFLQALTEVLWQAHFSPTCEGRK